MPSSWEPHHPTFPVGMLEGMAESGVGGVSGKDQIQWDAFDWRKT